MILKLSCMTSKEFHICYRRAVSSMIRRMRGVYLAEHSERVSDKDLAAVLMVKPTTFSRLSRACFSASPVVLLRLIDQIGIDEAFTILRDNGVFDFLYLEEGCPRNCHGDCEFCVKG